MYAVYVPDQSLVQNRLMKSLCSIKKKKKKCVGTAAVIWNIEASAIRKEDKKHASGGMSHSWMLLPKT